MRHQSVLLGIAFAMAASGCGGDDSTADGTSSGGSPACSALANAWCAKAEACDTFSFHAGYGQVSYCLQLKTIECRQQTRGAGVTVTDADVQACADAIGNIACQGDYLELPAACDWPPGSLGAGAACTSDYQCQSGRCTGSAALCGKCTDPALRAENDACSVFDGIACQTGLFCSLADDLCKKLRPKGSPCELGGCESPYQCVQGTCGEMKKLGESCGSLLDCGEGTCNLETGKCEAVNIGELGEACWLHSGSFGTCRGGLYCEMTASGDGTCVKIGGPDEPCSTSANWTVNRCMDGLACVNGTCVEQPALTCN